jgi:uncharacterized protein (DUF1778 family)
MVKQWRRFTVNFTPDEYRRIQAAAGLKGVNISNFVRLCVLPQVYSIKPVERFIRDVLKPESKRTSLDGLEEDLKTPKLPSG